MFSMSIQRHSYSLWLLLMVSINLVYHISVIECQTSSNRNPVSGVNKNSKKEKQNVATNAPKVNKDIESETQKAIEDILEEVTTLGIDYKLDSNHTINETINDSMNNPLNETMDEFEANSTTNQSLLINNETELTTPLVILNVTENDSFVSTTEVTTKGITEETTVSMNSTENELFVNSTELSADYTNDTTLPPILSDYNITNPIDSTELPNSETPTEVTDTLNESAKFTSTISSVESSAIFTAETNLDLKNKLDEELIECMFDEQIQCKSYEIVCFGSGEVDCGQRGKRSVDDLNFDNRTDPEVFKLYLEKQSFSENIVNSKCVLTADENMYFSCDPLPLINDCNGKSICKPMEESTDLNEGLPFWKVGLIAALTAIGAICFIIVAVIAYVSYNKLKVRPESSTNGYSNNPQNVTRV